MFESEQHLNTQESRPGESKREEFRKYLEKSGVLDSLTKVLVELYEEPEKPSSAIDFVKHHIGGVQPESSDSEQISQLQNRIRDLELEVDDLKSKLARAEQKEE